MRYLLEGYDYQYVKEEKKELSLIIPVLIYHGDDEWQQRELQDMFSLSNSFLKRYIPNFNYDVVDLVKTTDEYLANIKIGHLLPATFLIFKHRKDKEYFLENIKNIFIFVKRTVREFVINNLPILLVLFPLYCVKNTRYSEGYACVFCLV